MGQESERERQPASSRWQISGETKGGGWGVRLAVPRSALAASRCGVGARCGLLRCAVRPVLVSAACAVLLVALLSVSVSVCPTCVVVVVAVVPPPSLFCPLCGVCPECSQASELLAARALSVPSPKARRLAALALSQPRSQEGRHGHKFKGTAHRTPSTTTRTHRTNKTYHDLQTKYSPCRLLPRPVPPASPCLAAGGSLAAETRVEQPSPRRPRTPGALPATLLAVVAIPFELTGAAATAAPALLSAAAVATFALAVSST